MRASLKHDPSTSALATRQDREAKGCRQIETARRPVQQRARRAAEAR